jgi:hypothetical protein
MPTNTIRVFALLANAPSELITTKDERSRCGQAGDDFRRTRMISRIFCKRWLTGAFICLATSMCLVGQSILAQDIQWDGGIRGVLLMGKFRTTPQLNAMSFGDERNTLITELVGRTRSPLSEFQSFKDVDLAAAGALLVYLRETGSRTDQQIKAMSVDDMRNIVVVEVGAQGGRGSLQALGNRDLIQRVLGATSYVRGVLLVGRFRTQQQLNGMSADNQRNTRLPNWSDGPKTRSVIISRSTTLTSRVQGH